MQVLRGIMLELSCWKQEMCVLGRLGGESRIDSHRPVD